MGKQVDEDSTDILQIDQIRLKSILVDFGRSKNEFLEVAIIHV
jgi:hypothetical protein